MIPINENHEDIFLRWYEKRREQLIEECKKCSDGYIINQDNFAVKCDNCMVKLETEKRLKKGNVPGIYWENKSFDFLNDYPFISEYMKQLLKNKKSLVMFGNNGCGKTECGCFILRKCAKKNMSVFYISTLEINQILLYVKKRPWAEEWLTRNMNKSIVFIDDLGEVNNGSYTGNLTKETTVYYVKNRINNNMPVILASCCFKDMIVGLYGELFAGIVYGNQFIREDFFPKNWREE